MEEAKVGAWYHAIRCEKCGRYVLIAEDPSGGKSPAKVAGPGRIAMVCSYEDCRFTGNYGTEQFEHVQVHANT